MKVILIFGLSVVCFVVVAFVICKKIEDDLNERMKFF
jgi:hypothetical protein